MGRRPYGKGRNSKKSYSLRKRNQKGIILKIFGITVGLAVLTLIGWRIIDTVNTNISNANTLAEEKYYDGIFVDGIPLGGLTRDQAREQIIERQQEYLQALGVTVFDINQTATKLMVSDLPDNACTFDTDEILDEAWLLGRNGATDEDNLSLITQMPENPVIMTTSLTSIDPSILEQTVRNLAIPFYQAPQDAEWIPGSYDTTKEGVERLSFKPEVPGQKVDDDKLWQDVQSALANMTFDDVYMTLLTIDAETTQDQLKQNLQLVRILPISAGSSSENKKLNQANEGHTFTTQIRDHSDARLTNIRLANEAISGLVMPGEIFSMNERTGDRTAEQGYQIAPIDKSGVVDRGLGGGVCQVSGTLYNAAIRYGGKYEVGADTVSEGLGLAITTRGSHSLPSSYLHTGTDATVDIGSKKDLRFRNDFDKPVLIFMYYECNEKGEYFEHCDIYGPPLPDGALYDLLRRDVKTIPPDTTTPPKTVYSKYATPGSPVYINPRNGYSVNVYIEKDVNGNKTQTKAYSDSYKPQPAYYYVYTGETAPTPTPEMTPTPTPSLSPTPSPTPSSQISPTPSPSETATTAPTESPTAAPTESPSASPESA